MVKRFSSKEKIMGSIPIRSYGGNQGFREAYAP